MLLCFIELQRHHFSLNCGLQVKASVAQRYRSCFCNFRYVLCSQCICDLVCICATGGGGGGVDLPFSLISKSWFYIFFLPFLYQKPLILSCFSILHGTPAFQRVLLLSPPPSRAECWPSLGEGLPIRGWLLSAGGRMSPIQVSLGYRRGL